jgi:hypothetical protein
VAGQKKKKKNLCKPTTQPQKGLTKPRRQQQRDVAAVTQPQVALVDRPADSAEPKMFL